MCSAHCRVAAVCLVQHFVYIVDNLKRLLVGYSSSYLDLSLVLFPVNTLPGKNHVCRFGAVHTQ